MTVTPLLPRNAPFLPEEIDLLNKVVSRTTAQQRSWLAGFFAGFEAAQTGTAQPAPAAKPRAPLTILYASESGNSEALANKAKKAAQKHGLDAKVFDMADVDLALLRKAKNILVFAATWGEGDPPARAADFYQALMSDAAPRNEPRRSCPGQRFNGVGVRTDAIRNAPDDSLPNVAEVVRREPPVN